MIISSKNRYRMVLLCLMTGGLLQAADIIEGDAGEDQLKTFKTSLGAFVADPIGDHFFVGAGQEGAEEFSVAACASNEKKFIPLAASCVFINGVELNKEETEEEKAQREEKGEQPPVRQPNPLYNVPIKAMTLLTEKKNPVVVPNGDPNGVLGQRPSSIYFIGSFSDKRIEMLSIPNKYSEVPGVFAPDGLTKGIVELTASTNEQGGYIVAAVKNKNGDAFGAQGSGLAVIAAHFFNVGEGLNQASHLLLNQTDSLNFDGTIDQVKIGNDATVLYDTVDLHWDNSLAVCYAAINGEGAGGACDGVKALVVGQLKKPKITLQSIAPDSVFEGSTKIVGATGSHATVELHKVRAMTTSSSLHYVVVVGGVLERVNTGRSVFALPVVFDPVCAHHATLAKKDSLPQDIFGIESPHRFISRGFKEPATTADDAFDDTDMCVQVGGGPLDVGDISDIFVKDDAVFVTVVDADAEKLPGIFMSRALFDAHGRIKGWTDWKRVSGAIKDSIYGAAINPADSSFTWITGEDINTINTVKRTEWSHGSSQGLGSLEAILATQFPKERKGITGLFDKPDTTPGLDNISLLIATGLHTVSLIQTSDHTVPITGSDFEVNKIQCASGVIDVDIPFDTRVISISGGDLDTIGYIKTVEIAVADDEAWFFVGGDNGLAVLVNNNGSSWMASGLGDGFIGLEKGSLFKTVGSYKHIRKVLSDDHYLYILTESKLDRIDLERSDFTHNQVIVTTLVEVGSMLDLSSYSTLFDVVVSEKLAVLATSNGLYRTANGSDVRVSSDWIRVTVPECNYPTTQLYAISKTGREQDVARYAGGIMYVLSSYNVKNRAQLNRFSIAPIEHEEISDNTVVPLPDMFIKDTLSYFVNFGQCRNWIVSDGAEVFHGVNKRMTEYPAVRTLWTGARSGVRFLGDSNHMLPIDPSDVNFYCPLIRNSATGVWLLAADNQLMINE